MSEQTAVTVRPTWPPTWNQFWGSHERRPFTPTFNTFLDSLIQDPKIELLLRVVAWILRTSWGNWMDSCVNSDGVIVVQVDCARDLKLFDKKGEPDRRKVNPVFKLLEERNCIRFEGQEIVVIDNPLGLAFANSSPKDGKGVDDKSPLGFTEWMGRVWKDRQPARFKEYQDAEERYKKLRTRALTDYKEYKAEMSERVTTNEEQSRQGEQQNDGQGKDNSSPTGTTNGRASLYQPLNPLIGGSSSSSSSSQPPPETTTKPSSDEKEAVAQISGAIHVYETPDPGFVLRLWREARQQDQSVTPAEIAHIIHERGPAKKYPGLEFFRTVVLNCLPLERVMSDSPPAEDGEVPFSLEARIEFLERWCADFPDHSSTPGMREELEELRRQARPRAQKAGQR